LVNYDIAIEKNDIFIQLSLWFLTYSGSDIRRPDATSLPPPSINLIF